jgi:AAA+ superfamily predicted ATPase
LPDLKDLEILLRGASPILLIETNEEERVIGLFERWGNQVNTAIFRWSVTQGLRRLGQGYAAQKFNSQPADVLRHIASVSRPGVFLLLDFHPFLEDPVLVRTLREIALGHQRLAHRIVLISPKVELPDELVSLTARLSLRIPDRLGIDALVSEIIAERSNASPKQAMAIDEQAMALLKRSLQGLTLTDARRLATSAIADGVLDGEDVRTVQKAKIELLQNKGVLHYEFETARFADVGGLFQLKEWLELRRRVFLGEVQAIQLDPPKGILLLGVQGCGKSLAAKAVAGVWGVPLLRLDCGSLYDKYYGETERNLRESLASADALAPCVLWVDEMEKGIAHDGEDGGVSRRVLGTLLTWMAERRQPVFLVATANDIAALPPELLRKGRFDEIFFVDLPDLAVRAEILAIHLAKRKVEPREFDLHLLASISDGFSGSELEQVVVSGLYASLATGSPLQTGHLASQIKNTRPLSVLMAERVQSLREWAASRTVPA